MSILEKYSLRCPYCMSSSISSDNNRKHQCLNCNSIFSDKEAIKPSADNNRFKADANSRTA